MKKKKLLLVLSVATILLIGLSTAAFAAADYQTPAEIVAGLTGKSVDEVIADRQAGTTYGAQAKAADKLDEFQTQRLELYKENLEQAVLDGKLSQDDADKLLEEMNLRMADCDGTGTGLGQGVCDGTGNGTDRESRNGIENGLCDGTGKNSENGCGGGMGRGAGSGSGLGCGFCAE